jgi:glycosyltransferase involved in cell wall biosynthesis
MKIKVAHILNNVGGVDVYLRTLLEHIDYNKFEIIIIYSNDNEGAYYKIHHSIKEYQIDITREVNLLVDISAIRSTLKILKQVKPNLIHCHSSKGGVFGRIAGKILNIPTLYTPNAFSYLSTDKKITKKIYQTIEQLLFTKNAYLLACSRSEKDRAINDLKLNNTKILLWENSIRPIDQFNNLHGIKLPEEYICTISRPSYQKNLVFMITIFAQLKLKQPTLKLVIGGIGRYAPNVNELKNAISYHNLNNDVVLIPWVDRETVFNIISKSKVYISTSRYEGLPYSIIESMALSKPAVVTDCDGNRDLIVHGENGFVIKEKDIDEFVQKLNLLLINKELHEQFSINSKLRFDKYYNVLFNIHSLERIYQSFSNLKTT